MKEELKLRIHRIGSHYAANRFDEDGIKFPESFAEFHKMIEDVRIAEQIKTLEDSAASLIDWDVMHGYEESTPELDESHRIAAWLNSKARHLKQGETHG